MNRKGFTLTELLATIVVLGIIMGITLISTVGSFGNAKVKTEDVFISTIEDALDMYLDSDARNLTFNTYACTLSKTHGKVKVYKADNIRFSNVINSRYSPLTESDFVNPANEKKCASDFIVTIYRDDDFVYYYQILKENIFVNQENSEEEIPCLLNTNGYITNLPGDSKCLS